MRGEGVIMCNYTLEIKRIRPPHQARGRTLHPRRPKPFPPGQRLPAPSAGGIPAPYVCEAAFVGSRVIMHVHGSRTP